MPVASLTEAQGMHRASSFLPVIPVSVDSNNGGKIPGQSVTTQIMSCINMYQHCTLIQSNSIKTQS